MNQWIRWDANVSAAEPSWRWLADAMHMPALLLTPARDRDDILLAASRLNETSREKFLALLGEQGVREDKDTRLAHAARVTAADCLRLRAGQTSLVPDAVLVPRNRDDVLSILRICAEDGIAVAVSSDKPHVALNLSRMDRLLSVDFMSELAEVEAGISSSELARQLAARGLRLGPDSFATLGGHVAQSNRGWLQNVTVATPQGLIQSERHLSCGIVTAATLRVRGLPKYTEQRHYLFPDFAGGIAALHEAERLGIGLENARLSDAAETRFLAQMARQRQTIWQRLEEIYRQVRRLDDHAAALAVTFAGSETDIAAARKRFDALAARLGALMRNVAEPGDHNEALLERGVTVDSIQAFAIWSQLPVLYSTARAALDQVMREHCPRAGAHGLVLGRVTGVRGDGAQLRLSFIFPRVLGDGVAQAQIIRETAEKAMAGPAPSVLQTKLQAAIRLVLDPKGILP
ncbi:MAG: FAD-binding oxidoreductase [Alphaproteobacteria bacterium]|nr:FAD-binding oxidoreductase [Alphaproteobacteria bacterium]